MAFDAGAIVATAKIDLTQLDRDITDAERKIDKLASDHKIKLTAVFDDASMGKARRDFAMLDQQLSRDAMQRLRSSPQGSVLGALNALFSPHQVAGGPSPQQSAQQGALGRIVGGQGTGGSVGTGINRSVSSGTVAQQVINQATGRNITTTDTIKRRVTGETPGNITTTDTIREKLDKDSVRQVEKDSGDAGDRAGRSFSHRFSIHLGAMFASFGSGGTKVGVAGRVGPLGGSLASGIGPGILGLSAKTAGILGLGGAALGALPALAAAGGTLGLAGVGGSLISTGLKQLIGQKNTKANPNAEGPLYQQAQVIKKTLGDAMQSAAEGMLGPVKQAFGQIPSLIKSIAPDLKAVFAGAGSLIEPLLKGLTSLAHDVLPGLAGALHAVGPLLGPLIAGFGKLLGGILPGLTTLLKAAAPAISALAGGLGRIGHGIGSMLSEFAPVIKASATILKALLDVLAGIFPIVGKLAGVFANALAPIFVQLAGILKSLLPFLTIIGKILASLAGAVLNDLVSAFGALGDLLKAIAPSLETFAKSISGVFDVLENTGVFAILGDALESIVKPLGAFISALVTGLAPILPPIIKFVGDISATLATQLANALLAVLPPLTQLATVVLQALAEVLPIILPILTSVINVFTGAVATTIEGVAHGFSSLLSAIPPSVLKGIAIAIGAVVTAVKLWSGAMAVLDVAMNANPIGLIAIAIAALGAAFYVAWEKSAGFRTVIKDIASALLTFGKIVVEANKVIIDSFLSMVGTVLHAAADAFGWVPGLGPKLREASRNFDNFKAGVDNVMDGIVNKMSQWQDELNGTTQLTNRSVGDWINQFNSASTTIVSDLGKAGISAGNARADINNLTTAIQHNGDQSSQARSARQALIQDLEKAGINAQQANKLVDGLSTAIDQLHSKNVNITMDGKGTYSLSQINANTGKQKEAASGMLVTGGTPGKDSVLIKAMPGELIVPTHMVQSGAVDHLRGSIPGFAQGGVVGGNLNGAYVTGMYDKFQKQFTDAMVKAMRDALQAAVQAASNAVGAGLPGPGGGSAAANAALARKLYPPWGSGPQWIAWNNVAMRESGWNNLATNGGRPYDPYNVAYGIPQALPAIKMGAAANPPQSNPTAQINWMISYIKAVYGTPQGAWNNEVTQGFYDDGGWLRHGPMNATRRPEAVLTPSQSDAFLQLASGAGNGDVTERLDSMISLLSSLIDTTADVPSGLSRGFESAFGSIGREASFRRRYPRGGA